MHVKPRHDRILVQRLDEGEQHVGDTILFGKYSGHEIKLDGMECLIMKEEEVLAIEGVSVKTDTTKKGR